MPEIAMDVDDVVAKLSEHWIDVYNREWDDNLKVEEITEWAIDKFVKPECGRRIYQYLDDPHLYDGVKPIEGAKQGIQSLRKMGYKIVFVTSCPILTAGRKFFWLKEHGFSPDEKDYDENRVKSRLNLPYMLDDRYDNVLSFKQKGFLYTRPWNKKYSWKIRLNNWDEVVEKFRREINLW
jgi:5'-nucleotidase